MIVKRRFVDRYIPGYVFFGDGVTQGYVGYGSHATLTDSERGMPNDTACDAVFEGSRAHGIPPSPRWLGSSLRVFINEIRGVEHVERF